MRKITHLLLLCTAMCTCGNLYAAKGDWSWTEGFDFAEHKGASEGHNWCIQTVAKPNDVSFEEGGTFTATFTTAGNFGLGVSDEATTDYNASLLDNANAAKLQIFDNGDYQPVEAKEYKWTLTAAAAQQINSHSYIVLNGEGCNITELIYTPKEPMQVGEVLLWDGSIDLGGWGSTFYFENGVKFEVGDQLILNFTSSDDAQIQLQWGNSQTMSHGSLDNPKDGSYSSVSGNQMIVNITADNVDQYNSRYLAFKGKNVVITSMVIKPANKQDDAEYKFTQISENDIPEGASNLLYDRMTRFGVGEGQVYLSRYYEFKEGDKITFNIGAYNTNGTADNPASELCLAVTTIKDLNAEGSQIVNSLTKYYPLGQSDATITSGSVTFEVPAELTGSLQTGEDKKILVLVGKNMTIRDITLDGADVVEPDQRFQREVPNFIQNLTLYNNAEGWPSYSWGFASFNASQAYTDWYNKQNPAPTHEEIQAKLVEERENWPWATETNPDNYYLSLPPFASKIGDKIFIELERNTTNADYNGAEGGMQIQFWTPKQNEDGSWTDEIFVFSNGQNFMDLTGSGYEIVINQRWLDAFQANGFRIKGRQFVIKKVEWRHNTELDEADDSDYIYHVKAEQFGDEGIARLAKGQVPFFYVFFQDGQPENAEAPVGTFSYYGPYESEGATDFVAQWLYEGNGQNLPKSELKALPLVESAWENAILSGYVSEDGSESARVASLLADDNGQALPEDEIALYDGSGSINSSFKKYKYTVNVPAETGTVNGTIYMHKVVTAKTDPNGNFYSMGGSVESLKNGLDGYLFDPDNQLVAGLAHDGLYMSMPGNRNGKIGVYVPQQSEFDIKTDSGVITGVENVATDALNEPEVYTLDGLRVASMTPGRIYIVRSGDKVKKVLAK